MENYGAGVVVLLFNPDGDILIGKRKGSHGAGTWSLPGGKIEFLETAMETISRELEEETGIRLSKSRFTAREWLDSIWLDYTQGQQHWITLFTEAELTEAQAVTLREPDKCEEWRWVDPAILLRSQDYPLFHPFEKYLIQFPEVMTRSYKKQTSIHSPYQYNSKF